MAQSDPTPPNKYFPLLLQQPGNSYLYDRFYDAWIDTGTLEELKAFLQAHLEKSKDLGARLLLAFFYERQGQDANALDLYRTTPADRTIGAEYLFYRARAEARQLNLEKAITDLVQARALPCPEEMAGKIDKLLGELYVRTDQKDKAATLWKQLLDGGSESGETYEDLIELQIKEGLFADALESSDKLIAITKDPYKAVMYTLRKGDIHQYQADYEKALEVYSEALEKVGEGSWLENQICAQIGQVFERNDNAEGLRKHLTSLIKRHPKRTGLKKRLAGLLIQAGQTEKALALFQEILKATPGDRANQKAYVKALTDAGQLDKAIKLLEQLFTLDDQDHEILIDLADLHHQSDQDPKAVAALNRFLSLSDKTEHTFLRIAGLLERYRLPDPAETVYEQMIATLPESLSARQVYAEFLYRTDRKGQALRLFETVAREGDLQMMMRAANAAGAREHYDLALRWVEARYDEFSNDVTYLNHLCKIAIRLEKYDKALLWARRQLEMAREFPMIRSALSQVIAAVGTDEKADQLIRDLEARDKLTIQEMCLLCELFEAQNRSTQADAVLAQAARVNPDIAAREQIHLYRLRQNWTRAAEATEALLKRTGARELNLIRELIELYQKCARFEDALEWIQTWKKVSPNDTAVCLYHARLLNTMGRNEEAVHVLDTANRAFTGNTEILTQLAKLYTSTGQYDKAQRAYWRLYDTAQNVPERLRCMRDLSEAAGKAGRRQELLDKLKRQRQKNRGSALPLLALAEVYKQMGRYEERRQALLEATRLQTNDIALLYELASMEEAQGHGAKAIETLQRAMALDGTDKTRLKIARLQIQQGNREEGFRILTEVAGGEKMDPRDAESIAGTMMSIDAWDAAARFLGKILSRHPKDYKLHYQHALALEESGRPREALEAFIDLLDFHEEIPGNKGKPIQLRWTRQGVDTNVQRILPSSAVELSKLSQCHITAYEYRYARMRYGPQNHSRPQGRPHRVALPPTVEDCRSFALCHILDLAAEVDPQGRSHIASNLRRHSIADVDLLMAASESGLANFRQAIEDVAPQHPNDETVQALWILQRIEGLGCTLAEAQRIFEMFKDTHPRLALIVGLRCHGRDRIASRLFAQSLKMLQAIPDPGYYEINAIAYVLQNSQSGVRLTDAQRRMLDNHLIDWYAKLKQAGAGRTPIFNHLCALLAQRRDLSDYIRFLDAEVAGHSPTTSSSTSAPSSQPMIWHLPYPPRHIPGFPDHVTSMVLDGPQSYVPTRSGPRRLEFDPAKLGAHLAKVKAPILKIVIAMASGRNTEARKLTAAFLEKDPTSLAGYVMAASLAAIDGRPLKAVTLLDKARSLPMSSHYHRLLDGALVAGALELDPQKHPAQIELAKRAALRLLSHPLNPQQREELLVATETLGLTEQAKNLRKQILASAANPPISPGITAPSRARPSNVALIKKFFASKQTDSALRLALNHLRADAYDQLRYTYTIEASPQAKDVIALIRQHKAVEKFARLAVPPTRASTSRLVEHGRICELLGRKKGAVTAYERAVAQDPGDADARMQLALLSTQTDPGQGAQHLAAIHRRERNTAGLKLARSTRHLVARGRVEPALGVARMVTAYLDLLPNPESQNLNWVDQLADAIAGACHQSDQRLHPLYQKQAPSTGRTRTRQPRSFNTRMVFAGSGSFSRRMQINWGDSVRENTKAAAQRRTAHNELCEKMLEIPQLAEAGFARLAAEARARNALTDQFTETARRVLLTHKPYPGARPLGGTARNMNPSALVNPAAYLVTQAHRQGTLDALLREFPTRLKQNGQAERAEDLKHLAELYTATPDRFWKAADCLLTRVTTQGQGPNRTLVDENAAFEFVIDACLARELDTGQTMDRFILDKIEKDINQSRFVHQGLAERWLGKLTERDRAAAKAFADSVVALYESSKGRASGLSFMFKRHAQTLAHNLGSWNAPLPTSATTIPSRATSQQSRTRRTQRSRTPVQRSRSTRTRGRRRY